MTELERRAFLLWAAGSAYTVLSLGLTVSATSACAEEQGQGKDPKDPKKPATPPASKPAPAPKAGEVKAGAQEDGSFVFDPADPPKIEIDTKKQDPHGAFVKVGNDTVLVAQDTKKKAWVAVSGICSHKGCGVVWKDDDAEFRCPCHGSKFTSAGKVTKGPAKDDLSVYVATEVKGAGNKKLVRVAVAAAKK